jgi:hypothetical protein
MADSSDMSGQSSQALLQQLLMLLSAQSGTPGATGANGQPTPANPGSGPSASLWNGGGSMFTTNQNGHFSLPMRGQNNPPMDASSGGGQYGKAANLNEYSPQMSMNVDAMNTSGQFNQLLQGLLNDKNLTAPQAAPATAMPQPAPVVNNQHAYTAPSAAKIPGLVAPNLTGPSAMPYGPSTAFTSSGVAYNPLGSASQPMITAGPGTGTPLPYADMNTSLPQQLQAGMNQKAIIAQGGPAQSSAAAGIPAGSLPTSNTPAQMPPLIIPSFNPQVPPSLASSGNASVTPPTAPQSPVSVGAQSPLQGLQTALRNYAPQPQMSLAQAAPYQTPGGTTQDLGAYNPSTTGDMSGLGSGAYNVPAGSNAPDVGDVSGGGSAAGLGSAAGSLISGIGNAFGG